MTALSMFHAYQKAAALAEHYQQPAVVVQLSPLTRFPIERGAFDAMTEDDYRRASPKPEYFDAIEPRED